MMYFGENSLLYYAVVCLILAVIASAFGFYGIGAAFAEIGKILFFVFVVLFVLVLVAHVVRRGRKGPPI